MRKRSKSEKEKIVNILKNKAKIKQIPKIKLITDGCPDVKSQRNRKIRMYINSKGKLGKKMNTGKTKIYKGKLEHKTERQKKKKRGNIPMKKNKKRRIKKSIEKVENKCQNRNETNLRMRGKKKLKIQKKKRID